MYSIYSGFNAIYTPSGIGADYLVINPRYQHEVNKAGQLEFILAPENAMYGKLRQLVTPISLYQDSDEIFFGRVVSIEQDFYKHEQITVEGALAFLHDAVVRPFKFEDNTADCVRNYLTRLLKVYNRAVEDWKKIYVGNVTVTESNNYLMRYKDSYNDAYDVLIDHTINSTLGGYLSIRREAGKTYLDYTAEPGETSDQVILFGSNLLDLSRYVSAEDVYTVIVPIGKEVDGKKTTIKEVNDDKDYIESKTGVKLFGRIERQVTFGEYTKPKWLRNAAVKALNKAILEAVSIEIKAVDLSLINPNIGGLKHGTMVRVLSPPHDLDEYMLCRKVDINLNEPDDAVYTLGSEATTLTGQHAKTQKNVVLTADAADSAALDAKMTASQSLEEVGELNKVIGTDGSETQLYSNGAVAARLKTDGVALYDANGKNVANLGTEVTQVGPSDGSHTVSDASGTKVYSGKQLLSQTGYGKTKNETGGTEQKPYYTFGTRKEGDIGAYSVVEGKDNIASGAYSHVSGKDNEAAGPYSFVSGHGNKATRDSQTVLGRYAGNPLNDDLLLVGNGTSTSNRSNAMQLKNDGRVEFAGAVGSGLAFSSESDMVSAVSDLELRRAYSFYAGSGWISDAGASGSNAFGLICKAYTTTWHFLFMSGGDVYKSIYDTTNGFTTTQIDLVDEEEEEENADSN